MFRPKSSRAFGLTVVPYPPLLANKYVLSHRLLLVSWVPTVLCVCAVGLLLAGRLRACQDSRLSSSVCRTAGTQFSWRGRPLTAAPVSFRVLFQDVLRSFHVPPCSTHLGRSRLHDLSISAFCYHRGDRLQGVGQQHGSAKNLLISTPGFLRFILNPAAGRFPGAGVGAANCTFQRSPVSLKCLRERSPVSKVYPSGQAWHTRAPAESGTQYARAYGFWLGVAT